MFIQKQMNKIEPSCRVLITGANGMLGYHARAAIFSENCSADFANKRREFEYVDLPRLTAETFDLWSENAATADLILHCAGVNRAEPSEVESGNREIAVLLARVLRESESNAHVIFANSTHAGSDSPYGRGKKVANDLLEECTSRRATAYTNVILPHLFGERARPNYNNVTATLCHQVAKEESPVINDGAQVELLHAGAAVDSMLDAYKNGYTGSIRLLGKRLSVCSLYNLLLEYRDVYRSNTYPDLSDPFNVALFNTYREVIYPSFFPKFLRLHSDRRGTLFEAVKGGGGGQTFLSWTEPGVERGNHFHRNKVERFLVLAGEAKILIRSLFSDHVDVHLVSGSKPAYVDIPTLHTHSIVNVGKEPLLTLFWAHEVFDPENPDTYAHPVLAQ